MDDPVISGWADSIARETGVDTAVGALVDVIVAQISALPWQDAATRALAERLVTGRPELIAAVTVNTPGGEQREMPEPVAQPPRWPVPTPGDVNDQSTVGSRVPVNETERMPDSSAPVQRSAVVEPDEPED